MSNPSLRIQLHTHCVNVQLSHLRIIERISLNVLGSHEIVPHLEVITLCLYLAWLTAERMERTLPVSDPVSKPDHGTFAVEEPGRSRAVKRKGVHTRTQGTCCDTDFTLQRRAQKLLTGSQSSSFFPSCCKFHGRV